MPTTGRRTATKLLRLHPDELARITARAEACGLNPARFIRETALGAMPKARHHADTDRLLRALGRLGRQLEQAARRARSSGNAELADQIATALGGHGALVAEVVALRGPHRRVAITTTPQTTGAWRRCARRSPLANGRAKPLGDQLTIDFDPAGVAGSARLRVAAARSHAN
ncbi:MAG: plasmid mobilization protein [Gemmatimonadales bacterium]